eukprot:gene8803-751_t
MGKTNEKNIENVDQEIFKKHQIPDENTIIIGDLHGNLNELKSLMKNLKDYLECYNLVFLGDYVDRGEYSKDTLQYLIDLKKSRKENTTFFVLGNHDFAFGHFLGLWKAPEGHLFKETWENNSKVKISQLWGDEENEEEKEILKNMHLQGRRYGKHIYNSETTFSSYGCEHGDYEAFLKAVPEEHKDFIREMPWVLENSKYIFVHAGLEKSINFDQQMKDLMEKNSMIPYNLSLSARNIDYCHPETKKTVCSGHVMVDKVQFLKNRIMCDTSGGIDSYPISAVLLDKKIVIQNN